MTTTTVVTNLSDLSTAMRTAMLEGHATRRTAIALMNRGYVSSWDLLDRNGNRSLNYTERGQRAAEQLRAEMDATPTVPAELDQADTVTTDGPVTCKRCLQQLERQ